jgi:putative hydrolase of HD superfamily
MNKNLLKIFDFLHQTEKLKSTLRYNTTTSGRKESSAEHSWRLALMTFLVADELHLDLDVCRSIKIALVHDLAEAIAGDWDSYRVASRELSKADKEKAEHVAMKKFKELLPKEQGEEIFNLWLEYEEQKTKEAKYIKALDKIETLIQFAETGYEIYHDALDHIAFYADKQVKEIPELREILIIVKEELKREYEKGNLPWKPEYDRF